MIKIKTTIAFFIGVIKLILTLNKSKATVYDKIETINNVKDKKRSIIRLGDGEYRMILKKKDIHYQSYNEELRQEMIRMIKEATMNSNYLICIPRAVIVENALWFFKHEIKYFTHFIDFRFFFRCFMNKNRDYGDAMLFAEGNEKYYKELWEDSANIIFVHNDYKWAENFKNKYRKNVFFVNVPNKNSYKCIDNIEQEIINKVKQTKNNYTILISAGPTAKCLVYRLAKKNIIAYDCGHCWDEPLIFKD